MQESRPATTLATVARSARLLRSVTFGLTTVVLSLAAATAPANADGVTISAEGPRAIVTSTEQSTPRIDAKFTITDPTQTATGATICRKWKGHPRQDCQFRRFDGQPVLDEYDDEIWPDDNPQSRWNVAGAPGGWTVAYPIGFDPINREQCVAAAGTAAPFGAMIEVKNDAGTVLGTSTWTYAVKCTGIVGGASGPDRTKLSASHSVRSKPFRFYILDSEHRLSTFRICSYEGIYGSWRNCDYEDLRADQRTKNGWTITYTLTWNGLGSSTCQYVGRKWPSAGFRVQIYSSGLRKQLTLTRYTRLDC